MNTTVRQHESPSIDTTNPQWGFERFVSSSYEEGFIHDPVLFNGMSGPVIRQNDREILNFSSIGYLGWQQKEDIMNRFCESARKYGLSTGGSRATQGVCEAHARLEDIISRHHKKEKTLTFASGMLANIGFVNAITAKFNFSRYSHIDNRDAILVFDRDCHWSLWKAASHLKYGEQLLSFRHNDIEDLERVLKKLGRRKVIVVFESLYSADGSVAPIGRILDLCERHGALSYIDDANGFMVYGQSHRPFSEEFRHVNRADFIMVSLSKAVGLEGGAISAKAEYINAFEALSGTSIFTAAIQPPTADTAADIIEMMSFRPEIIDNYLNKNLAFRNRLSQSGFQLNETPSYLTSVLIGKDTRAEETRRFLEGRGICAPVFRYPAVKPNQSLLRLILHDLHTPEQIDYFISTMCQLDWHPR